MVIWGVWWQNSFWFSTGRRTRKAKNLFGNRRCIIGTEVADEAVILEGTVESVPDRIILKQLIDIHNRKYGCDLEPLVESLVSLVFRVTPQTIFGQDERAENFVEAVTHWKFTKF